MVYGTLGGLNCGLEQTPWQALQNRDKGCPASIIPEARPSYERRWACFTEAWRDQPAV